MFPIAMTITVHDRSQLNAILAAMGDGESVTVPAAEISEHANEHQSSTQDVKAGAKQEKAKAPPKGQARSSEPTPTASDNSVSSSTESQNKEPEASAKAEATYEDAKQMIIEVTKQKGREVAIFCLERFGVKKLPDLSPANFEGLVEHCKQVLDGGQP